MLKNPEASSCVFKDEISFDLSVSLIYPEKVKKAQSKG
jgi:hypothetical protein